MAASRRGKAGQGETSDAATSEDDSSVMEVSSTTKKVKDKILELQSIRKGTKRQSEEMPRN
jgi:hypothetical protein